MTQMSTKYYYESYKITMRMIKKYIENCVPILNLGRVPILNLGLAYNLQSCKQVFREQLRNEWPGLTSEVKKICEEWQIQDVTKDWHLEPSLKEWKHVLKTAAHRHNEKNLKKKMNTLSKLEEFVESEEDPLIKKIAMREIRMLKV